MSANDKQVDGSHYQKAKVQHWDLIVNHGVGYLEGCATKYLCRAHNKNGVVDLEKARHFTEKLIECHDNGIIMKPRGTVSFDALGAFCAAYDVPSAVEQAIIWLCRWQTRGELELALMAIDRAILREKTLERVTHIDRTGQARPFGFDANEERKD